jgi:hypothetical protein
MKKHHIFFLAISLFGYMFIFCSCDNDITDDLETQMNITQDDEVINQSEDSTATVEEDEMQQVENTNNAVVPENDTCEMLQPSSAAELEAATYECEIPKFFIPNADRIERVRYFKTLPEIRFEASAEFIEWSFNGRRMPALRDYPPTLIPPGELGIPFNTTELELNEGENELILWAIGYTGLIVEERFTIISDQTTPYGLRRIPRVRQATVRYDLEFSSEATLIFELGERDFGEVIFSASIPAHSFRIPIDVYNKGGGVFEVAANSQTIHFTTENQWGFSNGFISLRLINDELRITSVYQDGRNISVPNNSAISVRIP